VKCSEVLQFFDGTSNKVSNIIRSLLLSHSLIFLRYFFYKYMVVFLFNTAIYVISWEEAMYSYCCLCILIVSPCIRIVVYVFLLLSMYSYC